MIKPFIRKMHYSGISAGCFFRNSIFWSTFLSMILLGATATTGIEQNDIQRKEQKFLQIERSLKADLAKLEQVEEKERTLVEELESLDFKIELINTQIKLFSLQRESLQQEKTEIIKEIAQRKTAIRQQEVVLSKRLKAMYKRGEWTALRLFFNARSISEIAHNLKIMRFIARLDLDLLNQHQRWVTILSHREKELVTIDRNIRETTQSITQNKKELLQKRRLKDVYLEQIRNKKEYFESRCNKMKKSREELENWLKEKVGGPLIGSFQALKKQLPWPVQGKVKRFFGRQINPRFQTYTFCNGIMISAEEGTPVSVVADGVVQFAGWFQGYGNLVIVQHADEYFSLYGHMSEILVSKNQKLSEQAIIGRVGDTGSDSGFVLYFELRRKGIPLNPIKWLSK